MRYLKTFESFSFNENASVELPEESKVAIENKVEEEVSKLTPEQMEEARIQLEDFAAKNGLTFEDLKDPKKVEAVLAKHAPANESWLGDKWNQFKNWIGGFLVKLGFTGLVSTVIGASTAAGIIGDAGMNNPAIQSEFGIWVGASLAISTLVYFIGAHLPGEGKKIAQNIGTGAAAGRK
jgi:hypothetical protein